MVKNLALAALALAAAGSLDVRAAQMACGGVGNDERREMAAKAGGASLALEFSLAGRGNYIADVEVTVKPAKGQAFTGRTDGPICYLQLEPGRYTVEASYNGTRKSTIATIPAKGARPVRVAMSFPAGAGDVDPAPVSPEEKLQASKP